MSAGWQVGDLALCVVSSKLTQAGQIYKIIRIWQHPFQGMAFDFEGMNSGSRFGPEGYWGFNPCRFRKIKPDTEPCEEEFALLIKRKVGA
jgi:hypothetical protein